jgi:hypothetical protein
MVTMHKGNCSEQLFYFRNNALEGDLFMHNTQINPDIMVFTFGAHVHAVPDKRESHFRETWDDLKSKITMRRITHPNENITYVWKTLSPAHQDCWNHSTPIKTFHHYNAADYWSWFIQPLFDRIAVNYATELNMPIIDMTPLYLRPEAHSLFVKNSTIQDCTHYIGPAGPVNLFSQLILTMLFNSEL